MVPVESWPIHLSPFMAMLNNNLRHVALRIILLQIVLTIIVAIFFYLKQGDEFALAALYGGAATLVSTLISVWRTNAAIKADEHDATPGMLELYQIVILRFLVTVSLLALGLGWLKLQPLALLCGFIAAQAGQLFAPARMKRA